MIWPGTTINAGSLPPSTMSAPESSWTLQTFVQRAPLENSVIVTSAHTSSKPLHEETGNKAWNWGPEQLKSFQALKAAVTAAPILAFPTDEDLFRVEADSSDFASGAILLQMQQGIWKPVAYMSKALNDVERNYDIHDKEMLAIMQALGEWRHYLQGTRQPFEIWTDHKNLEYFMTARKLNR